MLEILLINGFHTQGFSFIVCLVSVKWTLFAMTSFPGIMGLCAIELVSTTDIMLLTNWCFFMGVCTYSNFEMWVFVLVWFLTIYCTLQFSSLVHAVITVLISYWPQPYLALKSWLTFIFLILDVPSPFRKAVAADKRWACSSQLHAAKVPRVL